MKKYTLATIINILCAIISVIFAWLIKYTIDAVSLTNKNMFIKCMISLFLIMILEFIFNLLGKYLMLKYSTKELEIKKNDYFKYILNTYDNNDIDLANFSTNTDLLYSNLFYNKVFIYNYIFSFLLSIASAFIMNGLVSIVVFIAACIPFIVSNFLKKLNIITTQDYTNETEKYLNFITDTNNGKFEIQSYNQENAFLKKHNELNKLVETKRIKNKMSLFLTATLNQSLGTLTFVIAICVSGLLALNNKLTLGSMMGIIQLTNSMVFPLSQIATAKNEMNSVTSIVDNFANNKIYDWWITKYNNKTKIFNFENIKINDLNFSYDSNKPILNNMNLCIEKNKKYAIIGESGTGKSTLAKILSGHISNYNGSIKVNSKELSTIDKKDYHRI